MKHDQIQLIKRYSTAYERLKGQFNQFRDDLKVAQQNNPETFPIAVEKGLSDAYFDIKYLDRIVRVELGLLVSDRALGILRFSHRIEEPIPSHSHFLDTYFDASGSVFEDPSKTVSEIELTTDAHLVLVNALGCFLETDEFKPATQQ